jgi:hypothetical protein
MQEFRDGSFGDIQPAYSLLARMQAEGIASNLKAVHFGSVKRLERIKERAALKAEKKERVRDLEERLEALEMRVNEATQEHHKHGVRVYPADALPALVAHHG